MSLAPLVLPSITVAVRVVVDLRASLFVLTLAWLFPCNLQATVVLLDVNVDGSFDAHACVYRICGDCCIVLVESPGYSG